RLARLVDELLLQTLLLGDARIELLELATPVAEPGRDAERRDDADEQRDARHDRPQTGMAPLQSLELRADRGKVDRRIEAGHRAHLTVFAATGPPTPLGVSGVVSASLERTSAFSENSNNRRSVSAAAPFVAPSETALISTSSGRSSHGVWFDRLRSSSETRSLDCA